MSSPNPLVAERQDSTQWYSGLGLAESINDASSGISSGSWVDSSLGVAGVTLDGLGLVLDPVGSVVSWGISWLMEHVQPLSDALDALAGDPDQIAANAKTWKNVAGAVEDAAAELRQAVMRDIAEWAGPAAEAYRFTAADKHEALTGISSAAMAIGTGVEIAGTVVSVVREIVRDLIAECISTLAVRLPMWLAEVGLTFGIGIPWVAGQVSALVAKWVKRIGGFIEALIRSFRALGPLLSRLDEMIQALRKVLRRLDGPGGGGSPHDPHRPRADADADGMPDAFDNTPRGDLSPADRAAIDDYTGSGYRDINGHLRNPDNPNLTPAQRAELQARADAVSEALEKLPARPGTTYRGVELNDDLLSRYQPGQVVTERGFTSTSTNPNVANQNFDGNTMMVVTGRSGRDMEAHTAVPGESEILYNQGTNFRVLSKTWDNDLKKWVIVLEES
jgi:uncharacterized protein YukE